MIFDCVPPTLESYEVPAKVLADTELFLRIRGHDGLEAVVLWLGSIANERYAVIEEAYIPDQIAYRSDDGVSVEVTQEGLTELISSLPAGVFVLCRVHSHPRDAYHSELDDQNMIIAHDGAISIVVPNFAQDPFQFCLCSVNELRHGRGWRQLDQTEVTDRFRVR